MLFARIWGCYHVANFFHKNDSPKVLGIFETEGAVMKSSKRSLKVFFSQMALFLVFSLVLMGCGEETKELASCDEVGTPLARNLAAGTCNAPARYEVVFNSTWSAANNPNQFPPNPHFSGLVGATHNGRVLFWEAGHKATAGIECMAETGSKLALIKEIDNTISRRNAGRVLSGGGLGTSPGQVRLSFNISQSFSRVTLMSMLAPSPDWFVGVSGLELCENGAWVANKTENLFVYDAGTDSGRTYTAPDRNTRPKENIERESVIFSPNTPVGTFTFTKQ